MGLALGSRRVDCPVRVVGGLVEKGVWHDGLGTRMLVRNSVSLTVFLAVAAHPRVSFAVIELAGRGITAGAAATRWVLDVGKPSWDGLDLADKLIELGEWEERLVELWRAHARDEVEPAAFQVRLTEIVRGMEEWPWSRCGA